MLKRSNAIEYRTLGNTELNVSLAGIGGNNFGRRRVAVAAAAVVYTAIDQDVSFSDSADIQGPYDLCGEYLRQGDRTVGLAGATRPAQVEQNAAAIFWNFIDEEQRTVNELSALQPDAPLCVGIATSELIYVEPIYSEPIYCLPRSAETS